MLGEKIGESTGTVTGQRVLPSDGGGVKIEVSFRAKGTILGVEVQEIGTYLSTMRQGGAVYGEGQGVLMTKDGESCLWTGSGLGKSTGRAMGASYRGILYFQTSSAKLARLNTTCVVFEYEVDENGNSRSQLWEWR